ncbi:Gfo/Idh/MocA family protein [Sphingobacterium hungaricum]|uniref:Oxidoreductase n=1 Tax=Sphingobacterium hungaricum TaxID=2082723 RepID=A0A928UTE6_9SPHI|nr:Gfo/Idh/MocA family oxidoreductase [Sphingobacterium hungaricum]MBE8712996.1 oxidoreductase [Sphingobacterium hungaricum]
MNNQNRRDFIKKSTIAVAATAFFNPSFSQINTSNVLKIGLVGCGGRGTGAASQALKADPNVIITAMGDVFEDRLNEAYDSLSQMDASKVQVDAAHKFIGFDAYQKVIDSGVDVVLLTSTPAFRPLHFEYAVNAGKHIFCEKPVAVDAPGVRRIIAAAKKAKEKNLNVVSGFCFRYETPTRELMKRVLDGAVGDINSISTFRNGGEAWYLPRQPDWNDTTYYMRNWYYYNGLSGDIVVEQAVHSLDMMSWAMKDVMPIKVMGTGGRQVRTDPKFGNVYDHFAVEFEYANGARGFHFTRQQAGTTSRNSVDILGNQGRANINVTSRHEIFGKENWRYKGAMNNMYQTQHDELFAAIRAGKVIDDAEHMSNSTLLAIMARDACYSGQILTTEEVLNSNIVLGPKLEDYSWDLALNPNPVAIPGVTKVV